MFSVTQHFQSKPFNFINCGTYVINGDYYTGQTLDDLKNKAIEFGIPVPECLNNIPVFFKEEYSKYNYTTFAEFYALDLPKGIKKTVREYILEDLFKDQNQIVFSASMMQENNLELKKCDQPIRDYLYSHYIDFKNIRFLLNLHHLNGDLTLQKNHIIILLSEQSNNQRHYQFLLSTSKLELACVQDKSRFLETQARCQEICNSTEVADMIQAVVNAYSKKKRLIVAPESFLGDWRLYWERIATAEELFFAEQDSYLGLAKFFAEIFPNTVLMYASSVHGLVDRYDHIKSYTLSASKSYCGNADANKLTYMSSDELKKWSVKITDQINQVVENQGIDEVKIYLYKGYMKHLNLNNLWQEPMKNHKVQSLSGELSRVSNIIALMQYFDPDFMPNC